MKIKEFLLVIFHFVILIFCILLFLSNKPPGGNYVCFKNYCFEVYLAKTPEEISSGLMRRENLAKNKGMFFVFDKDGRYPFWMKNTLIPLDIIWINKNKEVVFIAENVQPCQNNGSCQPINPGKESKYVLEINGGILKKIGLKEGDVLDFSID